MHPGALKALEFDRIVEAVCRLAQTPPGAVRLEQLHPLTDPGAVAGALAETAETARFLDDHDVAFRAPTDLDAIRTALAVQGRALEPQHLLGLATLFESIEATCGVIRGVRQGFPRLAGVAAAAASFEREAADIRSRIDPGGGVLDTASPELKAIREQLRKQRTRLRGTLESYLRGKDTSKYLQQQIVTDRHGRYVLVVRSEHRTAIPGIVHGSSSSGASLFLEPLSTVEINNDIVALEQEEQEEVRRILLALSDGFRTRAAEVARTIDTAATLDVLQARARFSRELHGVQPALATDGRLELRAARHPLLVLRHGATSPVVPVDVHVIPPVRVLVITGPNTGGKTVALKTAGLLPLMAQAGLLIPAAEGSQVPVFRTVFADIGDEQSIAEDLSTFSAHVSNIVSMDRALLAPALVLLDEAGTGTDPVEGGALAMAVIDHFRQRGAMVLATTHFDALKTYASTTEGVGSAGFGFDPETFAPTYRLTYGAPGSSLALEIAERLGLPAAIIEQARAHRGERETQLADHLAKVERELAALEHERRLVARERETVEDAGVRLQAREQDLRSREEGFRRRLDQRLDERLREARREIDAIVDGLKTRTATLSADAERRAARLVSTGDSGAARAEARAALDRVAERLRSGLDQPSPRPATGGPPATVGDRVQVGPLGLEGVVQTVHGRAADVDVRGKRLRARLDDLRVIAPAAAGVAAPARVHVSVDLQPRDTPPGEINVIGCTVDEALGRVERLLDDAVIAEVRSLRIIHGYGTGQLRRAIGELLRSHAFVLSHGPAADNRGGGGVTVVELKE